MKETGSTTPSGKPDATEKQAFEESCWFIDALIEAWQLIGVCSWAMVLSLSRATTALGLKGEFRVTPNDVLSVLRGKDKHQRRTNLAVSQGGGYNLAKLSRVIAVAKEVETGAVGPSEGLERLRDIMLAPDEYGPLVNAMAFVLCGAGFAMVLGASWMNVLLGGLFSLVSYGITLVAARSAGIAALQELLAAMIVAIGATVLGVLQPGTKGATVTVCAVIWFVPGFGLTIAPRELMVGNTLSGIIWFTNAAVAALKLLGGAAMGMALAGGIGGMTTAVFPADTVSPAWKWVGVPVLILSLATLMKVNSRSFGPIVVGGWLVWGAMQWGSAFGVWQGSFLGAAVLLMYANWYAHRFHVPSIVIVLPCVMILVPGVAALRAVVTVSTEGILAGLQSGYLVLVIIAAIVGGVLVGDALAIHKVSKTRKVMTSLMRRRPSS